MVDKRLQHHVRTAALVAECIAEPERLVRLITAYRRTLRALIGKHALADLEAEAMRYPT